MKFGFSLVVRGAEASPETFVQMAERAEALGLDSLWCSAHIVLPPQSRSGYGMVPDLKHPEEWKACYWEPFSVLSYLAGYTRKVTLGTSVTVLPMHNPFEVAKQVAEVDQLSRGRFVFGIGVGWFAEEFEVLGQEFHNRGARTDDALELMKSLWSSDPVTHRGRYYAVDQGYFAPKPVQQPHPPIWVAGSSPAALRRAARYGDGWHPVRPSYDELEQSLARLAGFLEAEGRSLDGLEVAVKCPLVFQDGPPEAGQPPTRGRAADVIEALRRYRDLGVDHVVFDPVPEALAVALDTMERFAGDIRPKL